MAMEELRERLLANIMADPGLPRSVPTQAYWQLPPHPQLERIRAKNLPKLTDIIVIGSGITSCSVTRELLYKDPAVKITILEARAITSGATGRNGGQIATSSVTFYNEIVDRVGVEAARKIVKFREAHYDVIASTIEELGKEAVDFSEIRRVQNVTGCLTEEKYKETVEELARYERDNPDSRGKYTLIGREEAAQAFQMGGVVGVLTGPSGAIWPYRFVTTVFADLLEKHKDRLSIETYTPVTSVEAVPNRPEYPYDVHTSRGTIRAAKVVYCTNAYTPHLLPRLRGKIITNHGHMTVQIPGSKFANVGNKRSWSLLYDRFGLDYMQQNPHTGELFLGGGFVKGTNCGADLFGSSADNYEDPPTLEYLSNILPKAFGPEYWGDDEGGAAARVKAHWSGIMGFTPDGFPIVGRLPENATGRKTQEEWIAAAFNGMGMVNCWLSGKALAALMVGEKADWLPEQFLASEERLEALQATHLVNYFLHGINPLN